MGQWNTDYADGMDAGGFFYGFALQRRMKTDSFVLTFSPISTVLFPGFVIASPVRAKLSCPTQEESHQSIRQFGNGAMEHGLYGWNG